MYIVRRIFIVLNKKGPQNSAIYGNKAAYEQSKGGRPLKKRKKSGQKWKRLKTWRNHEKGRFVFVCAVLLRPEKAKQAPPGLHRNVVGAIAASA